MIKNNIFPDKFDFFRAFMEAVAKHQQLRNRSPEVINYMLVDNYFFEKLGFKATAHGLVIIQLSEFGSRNDELRNARGVVFVCIEHAQDGLPVIKFMTENKVKYLPSGGYNVGGFVYDDRLCREVIESGYIEQTLKGYAKFDVGSDQDFVNLCQALLYTDHIRGDVVEIGCFRGSSGAMMLDYANARKLRTKKYWFFDVFSGFTYPEAKASSDALWTNTHQTEGEEVVGDRLKSKAGVNTVNIRAGNIITDPLPDDLISISVANIDVDLYEAVKAGLFRLAPLISIGGIMICEDEGHTPSLFGARLALEEFLQSDLGNTFTCVHMTSGQAFLIKHS